MLSSGKFKTEKALGPRKRNKQSQGRKKGSISVQGRKQNPRSASAVCTLIRCRASRYICSLYFSCRGLFFCYFARFSVFLFNASARLESCCNAMFLIHCHCFTVSEGEMAWRGASCLKINMNLYKLKSRIWFWRNISTFIEFKGYADFREILPDHSRDIDKQKPVGKFWRLTYSSRSILHEVHPRRWEVT